MEEFIKEGFKEDKDPMFKFRKELVSEQQIEENGLAIDEIPCLLFGSTGINSGFCVYTGEHFIWLNAQTPKEASEIADKIVAFEPV